MWENGRKSRGWDQMEPHHKKAGSPPLCNGQRLKVLESLPWSRETKSRQRGQWLCRGGSGKASRYEGHWGGRTEKWWRGKASGSNRCFKGNGQTQYSGCKCLTCDWLTDNPIPKPGSTTPNSLDSSACLSGRELCKWACCRKGMTAQELRYSQAVKEQEAKKCFYFKKLAPSQIMSIKCPKTSYWTQNDNTDKKKRDATHRNNFTIFIKM